MITLAVASASIAATVLARGRTAHSIFKLTLNTEEPQAMGLVSG